MRIARRVTPGRRRRFGAGWDVALAVVLAAVALLPLGVPGVELGQLPARGPAWLAPVLVLVQTVPLVVRRRWPVPVLLVVTAGFVAAQTTGADTGVAGLGLLIAIYSASSLQQRGRRWSLGGGLLAYVALAIVLVAEGSPERPIDLVTFAGVLLVPCVLGLVVRDRVAGQQEREAFAAERAVRAARSALARDLHDVVTHHVTAMVVQSEAAAFGRPDSDETAAFTTIGATGREALQELRSLLDALDPATAGAARAPAGGDLRALVDRLAATGYPVELRSDEATVLPERVAAILHDVAREALTNAMKHAPGEPVRCGLRVTEREAELQVENPIAGRPGDPGRGVRGMASRVHAAGGMLTTGSTADGLFVVTATVPIGEPA